jgi:hypothetical protein
MERKKINRDPKGVKTVCKSCKVIMEFRFREYIDYTCKDCKIDLAMVQTLKNMIAERKNKNVYNMKILLPCEKLF